MSNLSEIQIDSQALLHNLSRLHALAPRCAVAAVVKGNAYGHGMAEVVRVLEPHVDAFQIDDIDELRALRQVSKKRALVFGYIAKADIDEAIALGCEPVVYDQDRLPPIAQAAARHGRKPEVHLKVDALLGRQGVLPDEVGCLIDALSEHGITPLTAYAHFANIEDTTDLTHAQAQLETFESCFVQIKERWPEVGRHMSATSALMTLESEASPNTLTRMGIGLYGLYPSAALARSHAELDLRPVMRWVSHLAQVKTIPAGHPVGYGLTFIARRETKVGVVPQGYADGFDRGLSNVGEVLVRGRRCSVLGRVAMNMFAVDLSALPQVEAEDEVVILGRQGGQEITAEEIAIRLGTINYEITTRVSPLLPRSVR